MTYTPYFIHGENRPSRWLVICDHATNTVPLQVAGGDLGLPREDMDRHIAYDVGAYGLAQHLGKVLDAPVIASNFSRLVIDPNRGEDDPTLVMKLYDGSIIPANRNVGMAEKEHRLAQFYRPYHTALARLAAPPHVAIVSIHSFTRRLRGHPSRPWEVGILYAHDERLARPLINILADQGDLTVGDNEPYSGHLTGDTIEKHALVQNRHNVLVELRNDLIADHNGQISWAERLAPMLQQALTEAEVA